MKKKIQNLQQNLRPDLKSKIWYARRVCPKIQNFHHPKGIALLLVVIFMFSLSVMAIAFSTMVEVGLKQTNINLLDLKFLYTAEAGIEKAIWYLHQGINPNTITEDFDGLTYQTTITVAEGNKYNLTAKVFKEKRGLEINVQVVKDLETNNLVLVAGTYNKKFIKKE